MFREAIILAGGKGTRLKSVYSEGPKPMVPINDTPFLTILMDYLVTSGVTRIILATGYMHEKISSYYGDDFKGCSLVYSIEKEPLGTGGGIAQAMDKVSVSEVLVLNGDSFFGVDLPQFYEDFKQKETSVQLALKRLPDIARYGTVALGERGVIVSFNEKGGTGEGLINGGVYALRRQEVSAVLPKGAFSFEYDFLAKNQQGIVKRGQEFNATFIDIGTPESLEKAGKLFP